MKPNLYQFFKRMNRSHTEPNVLEKPPISFNLKLSAHLGKSELYNSLDFLFPFKLSFKSSIYLFYSFLHLQI